MHGEEEDRDRFIGQRSQYTGGMEEREMFAGKEFEIDGDTWVAEVENSPGASAAHTTSLSSCSFCVSAVATPKSMIFGAARPSTSVTRMFEGFRSWWRMAF